jgi:hypothetical protein
MLVAEQKQVPAAMFQHLVESLSRRVEAVIAAKGGPTPYYTLYGQKYLKKTFTFQHTKLGFHEFSEHLGE